MELRDLEYFLAMSECGTMHGASLRIGISQPALSKCLARLERHFGCSLFERSEQGLRLTAAGSRLSDHARALTAACNRADREVRLLSAGAALRLNIGVSPAFTEYLVPGACVEFCDAHPDIALNVLTGMSDTLLPMLKSGQIDLVVSGIGATTTSDLSRELLLTERFVVVARKGHRLAGSRSATDVRELSREKWVLSGPSIHSRQCLATAFSGAGVNPPDATIEANSMALMLNVIARSDFLGFIPQRVLRKSTLRASLRELNVRELRWERRVGVTTRAISSISQHERQFLEILRKHAKANEAVR